MGTGTESYLSNLIVTIISIALVAITALVGIPYLNQAWDNYYLKVKSVEILEQMKQVKAAANLWIADNGLPAPISNPFNLGTDCSTQSNRQRCWNGALGYQNRYWQRPAGVSANELNFYPLITLGKWGTVGKSTDFIDSNFVIYSATGNPPYYVYWRINTVNYNTYHPENNISELRVFLSNLCKQINKNLGYSDPPAGAALHPGLGVPLTPPDGMCGVDSYGGTTSYNAVLLILPL